MSNINITVNVVSNKPAKPYPEFPLGAANNGQWCKKIRGKIYYFGKWDDPAAALRDYNARKDDLESGTTTATTTANSEPLTVKRLCALFLSYNNDRVASGDLTEHTYETYGDCCLKMQKALGKDTLVAELKPFDFSVLLKHLQRNLGFVALGNTVGRVRTVFKWAKVEDLIPQEPAYGAYFKGPSKSKKRAFRNEQGAKMFAPKDIVRLIEHANQPLKAMILLSINGAFNNTDVGSLPLTAVDLENGWITFPRVKTSIKRRVPLWPETIAALRDALMVRPAPKEGVDPELCFLTRCGSTWARNAVTSSPVSKEFRKLADQLDIKGNFGWFRHTFQTIGQDSRDSLATRKIMGHATQDIADEYSEWFDEQRLLDVCAYVRHWLFGEAATQPSTVKTRFEQANMPRQTA